MPVEKLFTKVKNFVLGEVFPCVPLNFSYSKFSKKLLSIDVSQNVYESLKEYSENISSNATIKQVSSLKNFKTKATEYSENLMKKLKEYELLIEKANKSIMNNPVSFNYFYAKHTISQKLLEIKNLSEPNSYFSNKELKSITSNDLSDEYFNFKGKSLKDFQEVMCKCVDYNLKQLNSKDFDLSKLGMDLKTLEDKYNTLLTMKPYSKLEEMGKVVDENQKNIGAILKKHGVKGMDELLKVSKKYREKAEESKGNNTTLFIENAGLYLAYYNVVEELSKKSDVVDNKLSIDSHLKENLKQLFERSKEYSKSVQELKKSIGNEISTNDKEYSKKRNNAEKTVNGLESSIKEFYKKLKETDLLNEDSQKIMKDLNDESSRIDSKIKELETDVNELNSLAKKIKNRENEKEQLNEAISSLLKSINESLNLIGNKINTYGTTIPKKSKDLINLHAKTKKTVEGLDKEDYSSLKLEKLKTFKTNLDKCSEDIKKMNEQTKALDEESRKVTNELKQQKEKLDNLKIEIEKLAENYIEDKINVIRTYLQKIETASKDKSLPKNLKKEYDSSKNKEFDKLSKNIKGTISTYKKNLRKTKLSIVVDENQKIIAKLTECLKNLSDQFSQLNSISEDCKGILEKITSTTQTK